MKIYLVGGAVRNQLLNLPIKDRDWVIVGAHPSQLLEQGYQQVGKDFPVFLHPKTKEEYALARKETKQGKGYKGFKFDFNPDISLKEDLIRRDLTVNAIAQDNEGNYHDPFNGRKDLENRILRHVSPAFSEDPLRVLRVARFHAELAPLGFTVAPETLTLMHAIVARNEMETLTTERIWNETIKGLNSPAPQLYFKTLYQCGALERVFPELNALFVQSLAENNSTKGDITLNALTLISQSTNSTLIRFATLCQYIGAIDELELLTQFLSRLKCPNDYKKMALISHQSLLTMLNLKGKEAQDYIIYLNQIQAWKQPENLEAIFMINRAYANSLSNLNIDSLLELIMTIYQATKEIDIQKIILSGAKGQAIQEAIFRKRQNIAQQILDAH